MSYLYVSEQGASISIKGGRVEVRHKDGMLRSIPAETLESIQVFGKINITTPCIEFCLQKGITVTYYSTTGRYFGRLASPSHVNVGRQRKQALLNMDKQFAIAFSRQIVDAKIRNQIVILRRYSRRQNEIEVNTAIANMKNSLKYIQQCDEIPKIMGYEGIAARSYFQTMGVLVDPEFNFTKRSRRPPKDEFNSMLSFGYSLLLNEIVGKLEGKGLNPYFGILHSDKEKHPTLASDLMEEWRAVLIDSLVMSLVNGHEIHKEDFYQIEGEEGVFLAQNAFKTFVVKYENKLRTDNRYLTDVEYAISFRRALDHQINCFANAIENNDPTLYHPVIIR